MEEVYWETKTNLLQAILQTCRDELTDARKRLAQDELDIASLLIEIQELKIIAYRENIEL